MATDRRLLTRRAFVRTGAFLAALSRVPGLYAEELQRTALQTEGPFYPDKLPLDTNNDLLIINDSLTPAAGTVTHLTGQILDSSGQPVRNATVEIWQVDAEGAYLHSRSNNADRRDRNFQGFGSFVTGSTGEFYFRTIKPVAYPGRTPHIHFAVKAKGYERFTTQCYIAGEPQNLRDRILNGVRDEQARKALQVPFEAVAGATTGELQARFPIVLGRTPSA